MRGSQTCRKENVTLQGFKVPRAPAPKIQASGLLEMQKLRIDKIPLPPGPLLPHNKPRVPLELLHVRRLIVPEAKILVRVRQIHVDKVSAVRRSEPSRRPECWPLYCLWDASGQMV